MKRETKNTNYKPQNTLSSDFQKMKVELRKEIEQKNEVLYKGKGKGTLQQV